MSHSGCPLAIWKKHRKSLIFGFILSLVAVLIYVMNTALNAKEYQKSGVFAGDLNRNEHARTEENLVIQGRTVEKKMDENGYERAAHLRKSCHNYHMNESGRDIISNQRIRVSYDRTNKALYCPMCKVASTFWTRVFKMIQVNTNTKISFRVYTPFDIPISEAPASNTYFYTKTQSITGESDVSNSFKFLFVTGPFSRLFSAFVDKIVGPNPYFWKIFGKEAVQRLRGKSHSDLFCGSDVTFVEFLNEIIHTYKITHKLDCHVAKNNICSPCSANYSFVGKMENFKSDTFDVLSKLNQTTTIEKMKTRLSDLHAEDAIEDSVFGPFGWKRDIIKCIPWHKALKRIWRKLQMRGIIGRSKFPLSDIEAEHISRSEFIAVVKEYKQDASRMQKRQALQEAYQSVDVDTMSNIVNMYKEDFVLFNYDTHPKEIFERNYDMDYYGYMNYSNIDENLVKRNI